VYETDVFKFKSGPFWRLVFFRGRLPPPAPIDYATA